MNQSRELAVHKGKGKEKNKITVQHVSSVTCGQAYLQSWQIANTTNVATVVSQPV